MGNKLFPQQKQTVFTRETNPLGTSTLHATAAEGVQKRKRSKASGLAPLLVWLVSCLLAVSFVGNCELLATFGTTGGQHAAAICCCHSLTETVLVVAASVVGLKCSFHILLLLNYYVSIRIRGAKLRLFFHLCKDCATFSPLIFLFSYFLLTFAAQINNL